MEPDRVLTLWQRQHRFLEVKGAGRGLDSRELTTELFSHLGAVVSWMWHCKRRDRVANHGIAELLSKLDQEALDLGNIGASRQHVELATLQALFNGPEKSERAQVLLALWVSY